MDDLLNSQIRDSCRLALPSGLKELMSDISREVLRSQPANLYHFIADYLSVLLVTRENLTVASRLCKEVCCEQCTPELKDELKLIGLDDESAIVAQELILEYFEGDKVPMNEASLLMKLLNKISVDEDILPQIQMAIRKAYLIHQKNRLIIYESSSDSGKDESEYAAKHTLTVYRKTRPNEEDYNQMTRKIQASYRAYGVSRQVKEREKKSPSVSKLNRRKITFDESANVPGPSWEHHQSINSASSVSLAGSLIHLPKHVPYCAHGYDTLSDLEELPEKEHSNYDYTTHRDDELDGAVLKTLAIRDRGTADVSGNNESSDDTGSQLSDLSEHLPEDIVLSEEEVVSDIDDEFDM